MITKQTKVQQINELSEGFSKAKGSFLVNCIGLNVETMTILRKELKNQNADIKVIRNTLASRAFEKHSEIKKAYESQMKGSNAFILVFDEDATGVAKVIDGIAEENKPFQIKCGLLDGNIISSQEIKSLAKLPSKQILKAQFLSLLSAPLTKTLGLFEEVPKSFLRILKKKKD